MARDQVREAVGLFHDEKHLQLAADELLLNGFDHSDLSLLAAHRAVENRLGHMYERVAELEDEPAVAFQAYTDTDSRVEAKGALLGGLIYVGAVAAAGLVVASGGTMAALLVGAAAGGGAGGLVGGFLARFIERHHAHYLQEHLDRGGLLLWVHIPNEEKEALAGEILRRHGAEDVHMHNLPKPDFVDQSGVSKNLSFMNMLGM